VTEQQIAALCEDVVETPMSERVVSREK